MIIANKFFFGLFLRFLQGIFLLKSKPKKSQVVFIKKKKNKNEEE